MADLHTKHHDRNESAMFISLSLQHSPPILSYVVAFDHHFQRFQQPEHTRPAQDHRSENASTPLFQSNAPTDLRRKLKRVRFHIKKSQISHLLIPTM